VATWAKVSPYTRCPASGQLVIQNMGDSTTACSKPGGGWRKLLLQMLATKLGGTIGPAGIVDSQGDLDNALYGYSGCGSAHSGHPDSSAQQWVDNGWMTIFNPVPSLVADVHFGTLMLGTNDGGDTSASADNIGTLTDQFLALHPLSILFVATRPPRSFSSSSTFNSTVRAGVASRRAAGKNVVLADIFAATSLADSYDGTHQTEGGNLKIANCWFSAMTPYLR
jgi:hypothetical protein